MKKTLLYLATAWLAFSFSACDNNDTEGAIYYAANTEAVFAKASGSYFYAGSDPGEYSITLKRGNANGAASVAVTATDESGYFNVPATANFADGAYETTLTVSFDKEALEIGKNYAISLSIPENPIAGKQTAYKLTVTRDYTWEVYAEGTYYSGFFEQEFPVTMERAKENQSLYKLKDVYAEGYDYKFLVAEDGSISMMQDLNAYGLYDITTGYVISSYMIYTFLDPDPEYSYFDAENQKIVLNQYFYCAAAEWDWYDDTFTW